MDVMVATLISVQWTPEDTSIVKAASTSCNLCGRCFTLKHKVKSEGHYWNGSPKSTYLAQSSKKDTFNCLFNEDILEEVVKKVNKNTRRHRMKGLCSKKVGQAEIAEWIGRLLWSGLIGFYERPTKEFIYLSMKRYLQLTSNGPLQDIFIMFASTTNKTIPTFFQEMDKLQERLAFNFRTMFEPGLTLCIEKYKVDFGELQQPRDLRVALLVDKDTGFICNFFIYSISQLLSESQYIPLLYIIRKLLTPFCNRNYTVQIDSSAHINETINSECRKLGIWLEPFPWFGESSQLKYRDHGRENIYFSEWEGYSIFPLNGRHPPSFMFLVYFWLLVHISAINTFTLYSQNIEPNEDVFLEDFVEILSKEMIGVSDSSDSAEDDDNIHGDQKTDNSKDKKLNKRAGPSSGSTKHSQPKKMKEKGVTGLDNLGNTCYINAVIQCLSSTSPLVEYFFSLQFENLIASDKNKFVYAFTKLVADLWFSEVQSVAPLDFWGALCKIHPPFGMQSQQDAQELLIYTLDALQEDLTNIINNKTSDMAGGRHRRRNVSNTPITRLFQGVLSQITICMKCRRRSYKDDIFTIVSLPIPSGNDVSLLQCLQCFFQEVTLTRTDKIFCSDCKTKQEAAVEMKISKPPKILILHLKRFEYQDQVRRKLKTNVIFPLTNLDISPFVTTSNDNPPKYNLYSVVNHSGELEFGHYTAYCKHPGTKEWNAFDDAKHFRVAEDKVQSPLAYILFYANQTFNMPNKAPSSSLFCC
ncbi:ubiquitin carboxyl-terminal hydrolase 50 [Mantella aurantiaca]